MLDLIIVLIALLSLSVYFLLMLLFEKGNLPTNAMLPNAVIAYVLGILHVNIFLCFGLCAVCVLYTVTYLNEVSRLRNEREMESVRRLFR